MIYPLSPTLSTDSRSSSTHISDSVQRIVEIFRTADFYRCGVKAFGVKSGVIRQFSNISSSDLKSALEAFFAELSEQLGHSEECLQRLQQITAVIPMDQLRNALDPGAVETARNELDKAITYLKQTQSKLSPTLSYRLSAIGDGLIAAVDALFGTFGIADFCKPADGEFRNDFKTQRIMMLVSFFTILVTILVPVLGAEKCGLVVGVSLASLWTLSLIWPHVRPPRSDLPCEGRNLTKEVQQGLLVPIAGRETTLKKIGATLIDGRHVVLTAPSGTGKTETVIAYVQMVQMDPTHAHHGKKFILYSMGKLVEFKEVFGGGNNSLKQIDTAMGSYEDDYVLIGDELSAAMQKPNFAHDLKIYLNNNGRFRHFIGLLTTEEYTALKLKDPAFANRFVEVPVTNTDETDTQTILSNKLLETPEAIIEPEAFQLIMPQKEDTSPQPRTALDILKETIGITTKRNESPIKQKIERLDKQLTSLTTLDAALDTDLSTTQNRKQAIKDLILELPGSQKALETVDQMKKVRARLLAERHQRVVQYALSPKEKTLKEILALKLLAKQLKGQIIKLAAEKNIKAVIDVPLVREVIARKQAASTKTEPAAAPVNDVSVSSHLVDPTTDRKS